MKFLACVLTAALAPAPGVQEPSPTVPYTVYVNASVHKVAESVVAIERLPGVRGLKVGRGGFLLRLDMAPDAEPDPDAIENLLGKPTIWSIRRGDSTDTRDDLHRMQARLTRDGGLSKQDADYLRGNDPRTQRRLRLLRLLGQIAALYRDPKSVPAELAGNATFLALLPSFEAYVAMSNARGLQVEITPMKSDADIPADVAAILEQFGEQHVYAAREVAVARNDPKLRHMFADDSVQQMVDRLEQATLRHYRLQLAAVIKKCDTLLARIAAGSRSRRQIQALRTTADGLRRIMY